MNALEYVVTLRITTPGDWSPENVKAFMEAALDLVAAEARQPDCGFYRDKDGVIAFGEPLVSP